MRESELSIREKDGMIPMQMSYVCARVCLCEENVYFVQVRFGVFHA